MQRSRMRTEGCPRVRFAVATPDNNEKRTHEGEGTSPQKGSISLAILVIPIDTIFSPQHLLDGTLCDHGWISY
jgi:hypothetical protein